MPYILKGAGHSWVAPDISTDAARDDLTNRFYDWRENRARARATWKNSYLEPTDEPKNRDLFPGPSRADMARMDWGSYFE